MLTLRGTARGKTTVWLLMLLMLLMLLLPLLVWRPVGTLLWVGRGWRGTVEIGRASCRERVSPYV